MNIPLYQVDAFTKELFRGNPAAVCPLPEWLPDELLQKIAAENNLSETAFFVREESPLRLRWFTPAAEVPLCGHATLAAAFVYCEHLSRGSNQVEFNSASGPLTVERRGDRFILDFPAEPAAPWTPSFDLAAALGAAPAEILRSPKHLLAQFPDWRLLQALTPNFAQLASFEGVGVIVTAAGEDCDFVSRFFAPRVGIDEDPVTGSAHCTLTPYWSERLDKSRLTARQVSARGGELICELRDDRVLIEGSAVLYLRGEISL